MFLCNKAHGVTLGGERDERKPHDAHSVGFFDLSGAGIYVRMLGVSACSAVYNTFSSCLRLSHRERKVSWPVGAEIRCLCYLSYGLATTNRRRRASEKESYCRLYQDSGDWELFLLFRYFVSLVNFFFSSLLPIFSRYAGLIDHAAVEFGPRKNTSSFTL